MKPLNRATGILATILAFAILTAPTASASADIEESDELVAAKVVPMKIVGFDEDVARANGYEVEYLADGTPVASHPDDGVGTLGQVDGDCGSSWVYLYENGYRQYQVTTGWAVISSAVAYSWQASVGGQSHNWGGGLFFRTSWQETTVGTVSIPGYYVASASGSVVLANGGICSGMNPLDSAWIY